jgi:CRISPR/Cas system CSM-associated protein Csm3 (group 7 of RAMP superfamily)
LSACLLNVAASNVHCVSDVKYYSAKSKNGKTKREEYREAAKKSLPARLAWIDGHTCDVCKLFGSPVRASRLRISDGQLVERSQIVQVRDGVVLDRDSHTAVKGLKYDYEVVPAGARFTITIDLDNPTTADLALLGAAVFEWHAGSSVGGFTSRGLGRFRLQDVAVKGVDFQNPQQRIQYLTNHAPDKKLSKLGDWDTYFSENIQAQLNARADDAKEA